MKHHIPLSFTGDSIGMGGGGGGGCRELGEGELEGWGRKVMGQGGSVGGGGQSILSYLCHFEWSNILTSQHIMLYIPFWTDTRHNDNIPFWTDTWHNDNQKVPASIPRAKCWLAGPLALTTDVRGEMQTSPLKKKKSKKEKKKVWHFWHGWLKKFWTITDH